jgi:hypothetical protein
MLNGEDRRDGEESQEAQIFEGSIKRGRPRHRVVAWLVDELVNLGHEVTLFASAIP